jgi:hypothetical protein
VHWTTLFLPGTNIFIILVLYDKDKNDNNNNNDESYKLYMLDSAATDQLQYQNEYKRTTTQNYGDKKTTKLNQLNISH